MHGSGVDATIVLQELKALLTERGVVCNACAEKEQLIKTVRERCVYWPWHFARQMRQKPQPRFPHSCDTRLDDQKFLTHA